MWIFVCSLLSLMFFFQPFVDVGGLSSSLQEFCLKSLNHLENREISEALICGKRLPVSSSVRSVFVQGGLIHLMVVSGAHLIFLERFLNKLPLGKIKTPVICLTLVFYSLMSGLNPPVLRALFSFFLFNFSKHFKLFWSSFLVSFLSVLLCLLFDPSLSSSQSLMLSFLATFLQAVPVSFFKKCFLIYVFVSPIINQWQVLSPLTIFVNWSLAPFLGAVLFPLTFLSPFFPPLCFVADFLWGLVIKALKITEIFPSLPDFLIFIMPERYLWLYILGVCFIVYLVSLRIKRKRLYPRFKDDF